jgi:hypothetical protein
VISSPSTEQLIRDCCRELLEEVLPAVTDETAQVRLHMVETVLRAAAVRSAHEIAWMREESMAMLRFTREVIAALPAAVAVADALAVARPGPVESLHLEDVSVAYRAASDAFSLAMEAALTAGVYSLTREAIELLDQRVAHEQAVCGGWLSTAGR